MEGSGMKCRFCGFENEKGIYKCQKCGSSLLPMIPREAYLHNLGLSKKRSRPMFRILYGVLVVGLVIVICASAGIALYSIQTAASSSEASSIADETLPSPDLSGNLLQLPDSDVSLQLPEYQDYTYSESYNGSWSVSEFTLDNGLTLDITWRKAEYPFTKSNEEDYFSTDHSYSRLEGSEEQFFIINNDEVSATLIDRQNKNSYDIKLIVPSSEYNTIARSVLNDIVSNSSILQNQTDQT